MILYELLCGQPPFVGTAPLEVLDQVRNAEPVGIRKQRTDVPPDLETICLKCLQKQPGDRYASAQALADDLQRFLAGKDVLARPVALHQWLARWCRRPQRLREAGLTTIAVNAILGGWTIFTALAVALEWVPRPAHLSAAEVIQQTLPVIVFVSSPGILAGWWVLRGKRWAIHLGLGGGLAMTTVAVLLSLSSMANPFSFLWNDLPGMSMLIFSMLAPLCLLQTLACAVAWIAARWPLK